MKSTISTRIAGIRQQISTFCQQSGRDPQGVELMAVTKTRPAEAINQAAVEGITVVGENRVQEAEGKRKEVTSSLRWELIGHLQRNKVKTAVDLFDRIQSIDSLRLAKAVDRQVREQGRAPFPVLLQFNTGEDPKKYGFSPDEAVRVFEDLVALEGLRIEGLMTIAPFTGDESVRRRTFARLRELRDGLEAPFGLKLPTLSMGMTDDMREAILEGSTQVRVGTAIFGPRS